jgi:Putative adhesin
VSSDIIEQRDLDLSGITAAEVATFNGSVTVEAGADQARLEVTLKGRATYEVERLGKLLYIVGKKRGLTYFGSGVSFHLRLPAGLSLKLATVSGAIHVQGDVRALEARTSNGAIETRATGPGDMRLRNFGGAIHVRGAKGRVDIATATGDVRVADAAGRIHIATANGNVQVTGVEGEIEAATSNGGVQVVDAEGQFQVATSNGQVRLERVIFAPHSVSWAKTSNGAVEVLGLGAPGGLRIRAKTHRNTVRADLPGFEVRPGRHGLRAWLAGSNPAYLELGTVGEIRITR